MGESLRLGDAHSFQIMLPDVKSLRIQARVWLQKIQDVPPSRLVLPCVAVPQCTNLSASWALEAPSRTDSRGWNYGFTFEALGCDREGEQNSI
mmetsp:Transcript_15727/g.31676  ORF Transcript_15727/g.31676 Transcript_15727/m.31676 type:complete len:93 (+) Transcript_15727:235-513(+)